MKKNELKDFIQGMKICGNLAEKVGYAVAKNRRKAEQEEKYCEKARTRPKGWDKFEEAEKELVTKHSIGSNAQGQAVFGKNAAMFEDDYKIMRDKHAALLREDEKCAKKWEKYMEGDIEFTLHPIQESEIPDSATADQRYWLLEFVDEGEPEEAKKESKSK